MTHGPLTPRQEYAARVPAVMEELAKPHIEAEGSRLRLLPRPDKLKVGSPQDPFCYRFQGDRQGIAFVDTIAAATEPRFPGIMKKLTSNQQVLGVIDTAGGILNGRKDTEGNPTEDKKNIWVISPHGDILDIAYVMKATYNLLAQQGHRPRRTISILSKVLGGIGFELSPGQEPIETVPTMGMQCDDVFLTWPRTKSAKNAINRLPKSEVDRHNEQATEDINTEFAEGGVLAAMAPTGTTRMAADRSGALILPVPNRGTLELMMKADTFVLPVPAWFKSEEATIVMPFEPVEISTEKDAHEMFTSLAEVMTDEIEGVDFVYKTPRRRRLGQAAASFFFGPASRGQ